MAHVLAQDLKNALLQAALQGKLDTNNESEVLPNIRLPLNKQKEFKEEDLPFEIPRNWEWVHINQIATTSLGKTLNGTKDKGTTVPYLCSINIYWDGVTMDKLKTAKFSEKDKEKYLLKEGDLLICEGGDSGRACIWNNNDEMYYQNALHRVRFEFGCNPEFYYWVLRLYKETGLIDQYCKGQTIKHLVQDSLYSIPFPLPPTEEQHRIVTRVEEFMTKINEYERFENKLSKLKAKFPGDMKDAILQAAMEGRLTEQLTEDGNARELLSEINAEKERLIREKKIKKGKPLDPIEEIPFDIPESWEWVFLGDIFDHTAGKALNSKNTTGSKHKYLTTSNVYWDHFELDNLKEMYYTDDEVEKYSVKRGDLLVLEGGDVGRTAIWDSDISYCIQNHIHRLRPYIPVSIKYFYYSMMLFKNTGMVNGKGIGIKGLSAIALHTVLIPLPPLEEQKRIVEKLDQLLPLCDDIAELA